MQQLQDKKKECGYKVAKYKESRFWGVWDEHGELICLCVYRKGARAVVSRLVVKEQQAATVKGIGVETTADGFVTAENTGFMRDVAEHLDQIAPVLKARVEHTGGGVFAVVVEVAEYGNVLYWGEGEGNWGVDVTDEEGEYLGHIISPVLL